MGKCTFLYISLCIGMINVICTGGSSPSPTPSPTGSLSLEGMCQPSGMLSCGSRNYPTYKCSPPVTSSTKAKLTLNDFGESTFGGDPSKCDGKYHAGRTERVVSLSTGWYEGGSRCGKMINITASSGRSARANVVDECDSLHGCDREHAGQPPCKNNIIDGSFGVWEALGLNKDLGVVEVTWSMV